MSMTMTTTIITKNINQQHTKLCKEPLFVENDKEALIFQNNINNNIAIIIITMTFITIIMTIYIYISTTHPTRQSGLVCRE